MELTAGVAGQQLDADDKVTLVLAKSPMSGAFSDLSVTLLDSEPVESVSSFSAACQAVIAGRASQVIVLETPGLLLDKFEVEVLGRLAKGIPVVRLLVAKRQVPQGGLLVNRAEDQTATASSASEIRVGRLRVLRHARHFCVDEVHVPVTPTESELLWMLASREIATDALLRSAFRNPEAAKISSVVRQYIHRLRRKLEISGRAACIVSVRRGYGLIPNPGGAPCGHHNDPEL